MSTRAIKSPGTRISLALLLVAVALITLPFIGKAFHLDDTIFIRLAQQALEDPMSPGLPDYGFGGDFFSRYYDTHPPLLAFYLALLIKAFGGASEIWLHISFVIFPALAAVSMFFLARRFTDSPLAAALLMVATPGFMVMAQSIMTDVPALAFWLAAIAAYVHGVDRGDRRLLALAAAFLALAVLTTYQSFSLLPLLFLYVFLKRRMTAANLLPLAAALVVFGGVFAYYYYTTGGPPKLSYSVGLNYEPAFLANKMLSTVSVIGGSIVFPVTLAAGLLKGRKDYLSFGALLAVMLLFFLLRVPSGQYTTASAVLQSLFYAAGILAVYRFFTVAVEGAFTRPWSGRDRDSLFLVLWIAGVMAYTLALLPYASTRYLLPLFPPVILMFVRYARTVFPGRQQWLRFSVAAVSLTAATGLAASVADYQLSGVYRDFAATYPQELDKSGGKIWFAGEFGLRYYIEEAGGMYVTRDDNSPASGDYMILSHELIAYYLSDELRNRLVFERSVDYPSGWPVRVTDRGSQAGFYDQFHGNLPWSLSAEPVETIDIYRVR